MTQQGDRLDQVAHAFELERNRIVGLCGYLAGNYAIAEDLAQETFVEAWRHIDRLVDPNGVDRWLSAIARNVCLRWRSSQAREAQHVLHAQDRIDGEDSRLDRLQSDASVEIDLEREELAQLLDEALEYLPSATRYALLARHVAESPYAEIAEQLQLSEAAVKMRVKRGRLMLARVLSENRRPTSSMYLPHVYASRGAWEATTLWCSTCGQQTLNGYFNPTDGDLILRCPDCFPLLGLHESQNHGVPELFKNIDTIEDAYAHVVSQAGRFLWECLEHESACCARCGRAAHMIRRLPDAGSLRTYDGRGVQIRCDACGHISWASLNGLLLSLPEMQRFRRDHPRIRTLPEQRVEAGGQSAYIIRFASQTASQNATAVVSHDTFRVLEFNISAA